MSVENAQKTEADYQKKLAEENGVRIHDISQEDIEALAAQVRKVSWPKFSKMFGEDVIKGLMADFE